MKYILVSAEETEIVELKGSNDNLAYRLKNDITEKLRDGNVHNFRNNADTINFRAPIFRFVWNGFDLFNPVSNGEIEFRQNNNIFSVKYKFFFWEFFIYALLFSIIPLMSLYLQTWQKILIIASIWIIYLISSLLAAHRFENYIQKKIKEYGFEIVRHKDDGKHR